MTEIPSEIASAFSRCDPSVLPVLLELRGIILDVAAQDARIGPLTETLKWGQPAYLSAQTGSGTTLRLGELRPAKTAHGRPFPRPALLFHCQTSLAEQFITLYGDRCELAGKRAIPVDAITDDNRDMLRHCISLALTYHLR